ncbi:MAG: hypothetical protein GEU83_02000 [Pseudonocardiaceae bacterium]|nr:hypothetical protein [Pseudonocardiaceae bacterium]
MRSFDPVVIGRRECGAWVAYYRHRWAQVLACAVGMVRAGFRMPWPRTLLGAFYVLRANQVWAPYPHNDPLRAQRLMCRFYELVARTHGAVYDPAEASRLELRWWRAHRERQRERPSDGDGQLVDALAALYGYVYGLPGESVRAAAQGRADAMRISDSWVAAGCDPASPRLAEQRAALVRGYASLLAAVHHPSAGGDGARS